MTVMGMRHLAVAAVLLMVLAVGIVAYAWQPAIDPISPPARDSFPQARIAQGAELAAIGDCAVCHTVEHGQPYAGGRGVPTPFGLVYAPNITPDPETGIGTWSNAAFRRAMRTGIARDGAHLYPVLPYPHFTRATDQDIDALYAFLMTRAPVRAERPANRLPFPLNQRMILAGWNLLYLRPGPWHPDPAHDETWNRGFYLVEAVGHCGACHSPHNGLGAEDSRRQLEGGGAEGWAAPPLRATSPALVPWTQDTLATYLRTGIQSEHSAAAGPMTAVTAELGRVPDNDVKAIAAYIASQMPAATKGATPGGATPGGSAATAPPRPHPPANDPAQALFAGACASCHGSDAPMTRQDIIPSLSLATSVNAPAPDGVIQVILNGIPWREGRPQPYMPGFRDMLTKDQVAALAAYVRATYTDKPPWPNAAAQAAKLRQGEGS